MALYNNGYPATYQQYYPQIQTPVIQQNTAQSQQSGLNWIQGEQSAKSYLVAPNSSVVLFDSESQTIYIKSADASGMPSMKILDYTIRDINKAVPAPITGESVAYATKEDVDGLNEKIKELKIRIDSLRKKEADDE